MPVYINVCSECVHHNGDRTCAAYPAKIPDDIWHGDSSHTERRRDQVGDEVLTASKDGLEYLVEVGRLRRGQGKTAT